MARHTRRAAAHARRQASLMRLVRRRAGRGPGGRGPLIVARRIRLSVASASRSLPHDCKSGSAEGRLPSDQQTARLTRLSQRASPLAPADRGIGNPRDWRAAWRRGGLPRRRSYPPRGHHGGWHPIPRRDFPCSPSRTARTSLAGLSAPARPTRPGRGALWPGCSPATPPRAALVRGDEQTARWAGRRPPPPWACETREQGAAQPYGPGHGPSTPRHPRLWLQKSAERPRTRGALQNCTLRKFKDFILQIEEHGFAERGHPRLLKGAVAHTTHCGLGSRLHRLVVSELTAP